MPYLYFKKSSSNDLHEPMMALMQNPNSELQNVHQIWPRILFWEYSTVSIVRKASIFKLVISNPYLSFLPSYEFVIFI